MSTLETAIIRSLISASTFLYIVCIDYPLIGFIETNQLIEAETKWTAFRRHFQTYFLQ